MLTFLEESLKPCPTLSESGASNRIAWEIKALQPKRSKYFIQRMLATIEEKMRSLVPSIKASFYFAFLGIMV
ncbi:conserved domain protein [Streptococcus infantis SK970]|nr:conserved domain protein [Streptococcus infantis SK970]